MTPGSCHAIRASFAENSARTLGFPSGDLVRVRIVGVLHSRSWLAFDVC